MNRIAIIAALERELHPFVDCWIRRSVTYAGKTFPCFQTCFENGQEPTEPEQGVCVMAVAGGIGCSQAELAARAIVEQFQPQMLVSAGLAGALIRSLKVGSIVTPNVIVDAATGTEYRCNLGGEVIGGGVLVTAGEVAGVTGKAALVERFHGLVVDMEAAGVARVAQQCNLGFRCVKAVSDEFDFVMPPLDRFVDGQGNFQTGKFVGWAALRPRHWANVLRLGRNSGRAAHALSRWLRTNLSRGLPAAAIVTLD